MPYRIDIADPPQDALDQLVELGALDIEQVAGGIAAIFPDSVVPDVVARCLGVSRMTVSAAMARDEGSVWLLSPRPVRVGTTLILPDGFAAPPQALRLSQTSIFGSGHHPTTALCIEVIEQALTSAVPERLLDVGTGTGVLALTALMKGVPRAVGLDIDAEALRIAAEHARLNNLSDRLQLVLGGPDVVDGTWPLVVANILAAPLIEMAPVLVRRVGNRGRLVLSGIPASVESEVRQAYLRLGMRLILCEARAGWVVLVVEATW